MCIEDPTHVATDRREVVPVIGSITASMSSKIDGDRSNSMSRQGGSHAVPHAGIRCQAMNQDGSRQRRVGVDRAAVDHSKGHAGFDLEVSDDAIGDGETFDIGRRSKGHALQSLPATSRHGTMEVVDAVERLEDRSPASLESKIADLESILVDLDRVVVAFSGGADSAFLAVVAQRVLGRDRTLAVTAVSPSLAGAEENDCRELADEWSLRWLPVDTAEMERAAYRANDVDRCYHCKAELMDVVAPIAIGESATVVLGVNLDDLADHRPGQRAALERGAVFPMVQAGFTKADVREASRRLGLRTWDKPAAACLASRVPYGTPVSVEVLSRVDRAESVLRSLGFRQVRVRHYGETARVEVDDAELARAVSARREIVDGLRAAGYRYVTLDLEGFRSGNLNGGVETPTVQHGVETPTVQNSVDDGSSARHRHP
ncbi:MAG: ATP-dependent sacrificial sulfur transferase LarE [Actinomycetota bacterium]